MVGHMKMQLSGANSYMAKRNEVRQMKPVQKPCIGCIYFKACGSTTRTMPCNGRVTKRQKEKEQGK